MMQQQRSVFDVIAAGIVRAWFCPHLHRHDKLGEGFTVNCFCLHCRERWNVPLFAYREPKGVSPMTAKPTKKNRIRKVLCLTVATAACFAAFGVAPKDAAAWRATEWTQILNKILLGKQLSEQEVHTQKLFEIDEQTMRAVLSQPINTYGASKAASMIARDALASQGMPYDTASALSEHARLYFISPDAALTPHRVVRTVGRIIEEEDRAIMESVATVTAQRDAAYAAQRAMQEAIRLSQQSQGQTQALQAGNQINAGVFSKLEAMETGIQSANYMQARQHAAELTKAKIDAYQQHHDTRDFITGPYPAPEGGEIGGFSAFTGM